MLAKSSSLIWSTLLGKYDLKLRSNNIPVEQLRRGKRLKSAPLKLVKDFRSGHLPPKALLADVSNLEFKEPKNLGDALKSENWCRAMNEDYRV